MKSNAPSSKDTRPYEHLTFIQEDPTLPTQRKKPRTLTACDRCRARKVKCEQVAGSDKCDACLLAHQECEFKARDQRFHTAGGVQPVSTSQNQGAENVAATLRGKSISTTSGAKTPSPPLQRPPSRLGGLFSAFKRSGSAEGRKVPSPAEPETTFSEAPVPIKTSRPLSRVPTSSTSQQHYGAVSSTTGLASSPPLSPITSQMTGLFDYPAHPTFPRQDHMPTLVTTFFEHYGPFFPFLRKEDIMYRATGGRLWNIHALGIAALASRFSTLPEHSAEPKYQHSDAYLNMAKSLITQYKGQLSLQALQGLILLAWAECGNILPQGREAVSPSGSPGTHGMTYIAEAVRIARALGVGFSAKVNDFGAPRDEVLSTWWSLMVIDELVAWNNNQYCMLSDSDYDHELILVANPPNLESFQQLSALSLQRRRVGHSLLSPVASSGERSMAIENMRRTYVNICRTRSHFDRGVQNFQASIRAGTGALYVALHAVYFSVMVRSHLLLSGMGSTQPRSDRDPAMISTRNMLEVIGWSQGGNRARVIASNLFLETPLFEGGTLLLSEHRLVAGSPLDTGRLQKEAKECLGALQDMARVWAKASVRTSSLSYEMVSTFNVVNASFGIAPMGQTSEYFSHGPITPIASPSVYAAAGWNHPPSSSPTFHNTMVMSSNPLNHTQFDQTYLGSGGGQTRPSSPPSRMHQPPQAQMWGHPR